LDFLRAARQEPVRHNGYTVHVEDSLQAPLDGRLRHSVGTLLRCGERTLLLDLARVSRIDAAGVGELVRAHNMAVAMNGEVRIVRATGRVRVILERVGLLALLEPCHSADLSLAHM
jgi:anti-anti-sigma regulatory factor